MYTAPMRRPPPLSDDLNARSTLRVVAPSSPFDLDRFERGRARLGERYAVELGSSLFERAGFLAGDDLARQADLVNAIDEANVHAIMPARGGYGATRLLPSLDIDAVRAAATWLVGFSDVTALHAVWARAGLCSIHGPMVCSLTDASGEAQQALVTLLEGGEPPSLHDLTPVVRGQAEGRLFGGNLTVLCALVGTPFMPPMHDVVLALEDVTERPYRIDRMLTTMLQAGVFKHVRAVVLGQFTECGPGPDGVTVDEVLRERLSTLGIPVLANAPFGHVDDNWPLLFGARAFVDADSMSVRFESP